MEIRVLTPDDAEAYWVIRLEALETSPRAFSASLERHKERGPDGIKNLLESDGPSSFVLGAYLEGDLVATMGMAREREGKAGHSGFVWGVYVSERARRLGVASQMMKVLIDRCRSYQDLERLTLSVDSECAEAMRLYEKFGFRSFGLEKHALKIGTQYVHLHHMALYLH